MQSPAPACLSEPRRQISDQTTTTQNDTRLWRWYTLLAVKIARRLHRPYGSCTPISKHLIVKRGVFVDLEEAATVNFVRAATRLPVPKIYCTFIHKGITHIVMERIQGQTIGKAWASASQESKQRLLTQLRELFRELRAITPTSNTAVRNHQGGSLSDCRIAHADNRRFGPFETIQEFHLWLRQGLKPTANAEHSCSKEEWQEVVRMAEMQDGPWPAPVFTHGDLNATNILVKDDNIVGIIDWEMSGWYPHYWEYTSAWHGNMLMTDWQEQISNFLDPFPEELEMERVRQRWWGQI